MSKRREYVWPLVSTIVISKNGDPKELIEKHFSKKKKLKEQLKQVSFSEIIDYLGNEQEVLKLEIEMQGKLLAINKIEVKEAEAHLKLAQQQFAESKRSLKEIEQQKADLEDQKKENQYKFRKFQCLEKEFASVVLVHRTATTKQIISQVNGHIVSTRRDAGNLEERGVVIDEIFNPKKGEHLITYIPEGISERYETLEWKSIIDFCEMVANYKMSAEKGKENNIIILYSNFDIAEILKANGLTVY